MQAINQRLTPGLIVIWTAAHWAKRSRCRRV